MKAMVFTVYGPPEVFQLKEVEKPTPKEDEVLIRVHATPVTFGEVISRNFTFSPSEFWLPLPLYPIARMQFGYRKPKVNILGAEFAGVIEATGADVTLFNEGDQVFGFLGESFGANAEYLSTPEDGLLAIKPANLTFEQASAVCFNAMIALSFIRDKANIKSGDKVLINGASGGIGQYALQLAKYYGAEVTGVCSTTKVEFVKSIGADFVIDYTKEDFTKNGQTYNVIFDTARITSYSKCKSSLKDNGRYLLAVFGMREVFQTLRTSLIGSKKVIGTMGSIDKERLHFLRELVEAGEIKVVIDRTYPLEQLVEAHRYVESGQKKGNVVITVEPNNKN